MPAPTWGPGSPRTSSRRASLAPVSPPPRPRFEVMPAPTWGPGSPRTEGGSGRRRTAYLGGGERGRAPTWWSAPFTSVASDSDEAERLDGVALLNELGDRGIDLAAGEVVDVKA